MLETEVNNSRFCLAAVAAALFLLPAQAENCAPLAIYTTIPLTHIDGYASEFVPVEIAGVPKLLLLDTGAFFSTITSATVDELHLRPRDASIYIFDVTGAKASRYVSTTFKFGTLQGDGIQFMLSPSSIDDFGDPRVAGLLGASILAGYDLSIDFGAHTLTLLSPNHCDGKVVYWPERPVAMIPFKLQNRNEIILTVTLDGKEVVAQLDTGASSSTLEKKKAARLFDIVPGSADTPVAGNLNGAEGVTTWKHRFKSLSLAGIEVANPEIKIIPDKISEKVNTWSTGSLLDARANGNRDEAPMLLGMNVLKDLHIYIAYKEKKLYITSSGKPAVAATPAAPVKAN